MRHSPSPPPAVAAMAKRLDDPLANAVPLDAASLFSVKGKVALCTGGATGIGLMISKALVANGAVVYICSRKKPAIDKAVEELNTQFARLGGKAISLPGDLSNLSGVEAVVASLGAQTTKLDILVANAGVTWGAPYDEYPDSAWQKVMDVNVRHVFNLIQKLTPLLELSASKGDPSRVITIASVDGVRASQTQGPTAAFAYTVSKGAVVHLTKALCRALSSRNITVNCIAPGLFPSQMTKFIAEADLWNMQAKLNPLGRNGQTSDMAGTALYLCSKAGAFTNGVTITLDGGLLLHDAGLGFSKM